MLPILAKFNLVIPLFLHGIMSKSRQKASDASSNALVSTENNIISALNKKFDDLNTKMSDLSEEFGSFKTEIMKLVSDKQEEIDHLKNKVQTLETSVQKLQNSIDDQEAYERRDCLVLSGEAIPAVSSGENCGNLAREVIENKLKVKLSDSDLSTAHRIGKKPTTQGPDRRKIIIKLCRRDLKKDLIFASKNAPRNGPPLYINESLTAPRNRILFILRKIRKSHPSIVTGCSSFDGRVYAYTKNPNDSERNRRHLVNTNEMLVEFCRLHVKIPMENFLDASDY